MKGTSSVFLLDLSFGKLRQILASLAVTFGVIFNCFPFLLLFS